MSLKKGGSGFTSTPTCSISGPQNKTKYTSPTGSTIYAGGTQAKCTATITGGGGKGASCSAVITQTVGAAAYQPSFGATPGWDMATGLGGVNAYNLVFNSSW